MTSDKTRGRFFDRFDARSTLQLVIVGSILGTLYVAWLLATSSNLGFARDEGFYFQAARDYARWFEQLFSQPKEALKQANIDAIWNENHEHPSLMKSLFSLSWMYLHKKWALFTDASTAFRFPGMVMGGISVAITYIFAARLFSVRAGLFAAIALMMMPHYFYNAHLACFDIGIVAMWAASVGTYYRAIRSRRILDAIVFGITYGLTLETKHNAWILPAVFVPHALYVMRHELGADVKKGKISFPLPLLAMVTLGPAVFLACWPWLWSDTIPRLQEYVNFHVHHVYYNMEFLGKNIYGPPSPKLYMPLLVAASVPAITLLLALVGVGLAARSEIANLWRGLALPKWRYMEDLAARQESLVPKRDRHAEPILLLGLAMCAPLAVFLLPSTPIFGGTKHWMPAYPFLAIFAGLGFDWLCFMTYCFLRVRLSAQKKVLAPWVIPAVLFLTLLAPTMETVHSHPFGLSAYTPLVGGTAGGADLGLNRQFWGFTTQSVAPYFKNAKPGTTLFIHDTAWSAWEQMQREHRVPQTLQATGAPGDSAYSLVHHELHMNEVDYQIWVAYEHTHPDWVLAHDGVPIVSVYKR